MLFSGRRYYSPDEECAQFHNFYEQLVVDEILRKEKEAADHEDLLADIACVALNQLPPRYIRYDVDMQFFLSPNEYAEIETKVSNAVQKAIKQVNKNRYFHHDRL